MTDADHQTEFQWGGQTERRPRPTRRKTRAAYPHVQLDLGLPPKQYPGSVIPDDWEPLTGTPGTRAQCPTTRPCPYVRCEWNLWMISGIDRPGRRGGGRLLPRSVVLPVYRQNCGADVADAVRDGRLQAVDVAELVGISSKQLRRLVAKGRGKVRGSEEGRELDE